MRIADIPASWACALLWIAAIAFAPTVRAADEPAGEGFRVRGGYLHLAPGILSMPTIADGQERLSYTWGVGGGYHRPAGRRFMAQIGAFFEHVPMGPHGYPYIWRHFMRVGPELRLGGGSTRVFGYGLVRLGLDVLYQNVRYPGEKEGRSGTFSLFLMTLGGGVQGLLGRRFVIGGEPGIDLTMGGGNDVFPQFRLRAFIGLKF